MADTTELDRQSEVMETANTIGRFIDWLRDTHKAELMVFAEEYETHMCPDDEFHRDTPEKCHQCKGKETYKTLTFQGWTHLGIGPQKLLEQFFDIDPEKIENERRAILDEIRAANANR